MKKSIHRILAPILILIMLLAAIALTTYIIQVGNTTDVPLILSTASGEVVHIPAGTSHENNIYYNFDDSTSNKHYDCFNAETGEYLIDTTSVTNIS